MALLRIHTRGGVIVELRHTLEGLAADFATCNTSLIPRLTFERLCNIFHMDPQKVNEAIALSDIFILTSYTRTLEGLLLLQRVAMLQTNMKI